MSNEGPPERPAVSWFEATGFGLSTRAGVAIVLVLLPSAVFGIWMVISAFTSVPPPVRWGVGGPRVVCATRLSQLGGVFASGAIFSGNRPPYDGAALFLWYRRQNFIQSGQESVLACPKDDAVHVPESADERRAYATLDLTDRVVVRAHCSYAVRDFTAFPLDPDDPTAVPIACDAPDASGEVTNHVNGLNVLYSDGSVHFRDRAFLGIGPDDPIVVGPHSPIELLRPLVVLPDR